jgi:small GTP-binding protein
MTNGRIVRAQIWDTAGQEKYKALTKNYYRDAVGAIVVYDVTRPETLESAKGWIKDLKEKAGSDVVMLLVGNKIDLVELREVRKEDGIELAE